MLYTYILQDVAYHYFVMQPSGVQSSDFFFLFLFFSFFFVCGCFLLPGNFSVKQSGLFVAVLHKKDPQNKKKEKRKKVTQGLIKYCTPRSMNSLPNPRFALKNENNHIKMCLMVLCCFFSYFWSIRKTCSDILNFTNKPIIWIIAIKIFI